MALLSDIKGALAKLAQLVFPTELFRSGDAFVRPKVIHLAELPTNSETQEAFALSISEGDLADIVLSSASVLTKTVTLPRAALGKADAAISLQLKQSMPAQAAGLVWRKSAVSKTAETVVFSVFILKKAQIDTLMALSNTMGAKVSSVGIDVPSVEPFYRADESTSATTLWRNCALASVLMGTTWVVSQPLVKAGPIKAEIATLEKSVADLQAKALEARTTAGDAAGHAAAFAEAAEQFNGQRQRLDELASLTAALPDDTWVSELDLTGDRLSLTVFSASEPLSILALIDQLPWTGPTQLDGTIIPDSTTGQSRFQITVALKGMTPNG